MMNENQIATTEEIVEELRQGRMVIMVDDEDRENEGDILMASDYITPEAINFMATHARGLICMTITAEQANQLNLHSMAQVNGSSFGTNFTQSIEAAEGVTTGISAADRALTIKVASRPNAKPTDIVSPGHIFPCRAVPGGVLVRAGHTEAGCDLTKLANLTPSATICEIMNEDGTMARLPDLMKFAEKHQLKIGTIADLIQYRIEHETMIERIGEHTLNTVWGNLQAIAYKDKAFGAVHIALVYGQIKAGEDVLVRVHEPTSVLDLLDRSGDHSWGFNDAIKAIKEHGVGVVVMLNCQGSEENLLSKIAQWRQPAVKSQEKKVSDRYDLRNYGIGAQILRDVGVDTMQLLAVPRKMPSMAGYGLTVTGFKTLQD
ncbi:bifunctional 3,4-dihydroxy-2-butanone-4-phosphate synthase/GTP cyclohydrolase II [Basilea psittacipulmonis]|uniref:3,4-dihydroxy-2-butanone 4-phosphate synthase n=1 Tax=Basilea psittacipulmonis DSM 24701 TaxID=1072685 RepID=A0A077DC72_9BURK|nr:bifunctional 3,4-dihydroxy-2-butanone-4-phosphate synthase/GTP cyclohydrolase II [Basilea psittacipulmonis]AIL32485.1 3,4-dihydroxy-2-butanone 4-phosphate synthase [Basilea psittacipulmonis DSM 24701]